MAILMRVSLPPSWLCGVYIRVCRTARQWRNVTTSLSSVANKNASNDDTMAEILLFALRGGTGFGHFPANRMFTPRGAATGCCVRRVKLVQEMHRKNAVEEVSVEVPRRC